MAKNKEKNHFLTQAYTASQEVAGKSTIENPRKALENYSAIREKLFSNFKQAEKDGADMGFLEDYIDESIEGASKKAQASWKEFEDRVSTSIDIMHQDNGRLKSRAEMIGQMAGVEDNARVIELAKDSFGQKKWDRMTRNVDDVKLSLKDRMMNKLGGIKATLMDSMQSIRSGRETHTHYDAHNERVSAMKTAANEKVYADIAREQLQGKADKLTAIADAREKALAMAAEGDARATSALMKGDTSFTKLAYKDGNIATARQSNTAKASKGGSWGWKGKAGAVVGLLALGGIIGNQFAGGKKSNAELYNPNPQPQYYS